MSIPYKYSYASIQRRLDKIPSEKRSEERLKIDIQNILTGPTNSANAWRLVESLFSSHAPAAVAAAFKEAVDRFFAQENTLNNPDDIRLTILHKEVNQIFNSDLSWEVKFELIFSENIADQIYSIIQLDYYDPDTSYEEDVRAFVNALNEKMAGES